MASALPKDAIKQAETLDKVMLKLWAMESTGSLAKHREYPSASERRKAIDHAVRAVLAGFPPDPS